jgi:uncharacterized protein with FMN-binding domain
VNGLPRKTISTLAAAMVLAYPPLTAWGAVHGQTATKPKKKVTKVTKTFTGIAAPCKRWGPLQVRIKVQQTITTNGKSRKVAIKILDLDFPIISDYTDKTVYINKLALPLLKEEALQLQSTDVELISGATDTWVSFKQSLQTALVKAKK